MLVRALPYVAAWLALVLLLVDVTPTRVGLSVVAAVAALGARALLPRPTLAIALSVVAVGALAALTATAASLAGLGRSVAGGVFGAFAVYCAMRALRG